MRADVAVGQRAENGVGDGVRQNVGVGMAFEPVAVRDGDAAEPDLVAGAKSMDVRSPGRCGCREGLSTTWFARAKNPPAW